MTDYLTQIADETSESTLLEILNEERPGTARVLAGSEKAAPNILAKLHTHPSAVVRSILARNKKTPADILKVLLLDTEVIVRDSARFTLAKLGRPTPILKTASNKEKLVEEVVEEIKKEKQKVNNKRKDRNKNRKKDKK